MKKLLSAALAIATVATCIGAFTACNTENAELNADTAKKAINAVSFMYRDLSGSETAADYTVIGQTKANDIMCPIDWTVAPVGTVENFSNYVSVGEMNPDDGLVTISISKATTVIEYTLKASVTVGSATESVDFKCSIPATLASGEEEVEVSIDFTGTTNRTVFTNEQQVWTQNGITLTNDKAGSVTPVSNGDSSYHVRLYQTSNVKIEYPGMIKLVFHSDNTYSYHSQLVTTLEAANLGTVTSDTEKATATLVLAYPSDMIEFVATKQMRLTSIDIIANKNGTTDQQKLDAAKAALDLATKSYTATGTYDLPATQGVTAVTWAVTSDYAQIDGGKLKVTSMPSAETELTLTATISYNGLTATKEITVKLVPLSGVTHSGKTVEDAFTATEVKEFIKKTVEAGKTTDDEYYVKGYIIEPGVTYTSTSTYKNFGDVYIADSASSSKDSDDAFYVFRPVANDVVASETGFNVGDLVTFKGKLQNYEKDSTLTPELVSGTCVAKVSVADSGTDAEKAQAALSAAVASIPKTVTGNITLTSSVTGVTVAITNSSNTAVIALNGTVTSPATDTEVTLTITATCGAATKTADVTVTVIAPKTFEVGTYKLVLDLTNAADRAKKYYFVGEMDGNYGKVSDDESAAVDVEIAAVTGGYTLKAGDKYIAVVKSGTYYNFGLVDTAEVWTLNQELGVLTFTLDSKEYYLGTRTNNGTTYTSISASEIKYISGTNAANVGVSQFPISYEKVEVLPPDSGDADKVAAAKAAVTLKATYEAGTVTLPATNNGANLSWAVKTGTNVTIDGTAMTVTNPDGANVEVTVTVTITSGDVTDTKDITFTVVYVVPVNYGTIEAPLSVTEALAIATEQCKNSNDVSKQVVYMTGVLTNVPTDKGTYYQNLYLGDATDTTKTILVYSVNLRSNVAAPAVNDVLVICGYIKNYNGTIEFASNSGTNVYVESNTRGTSTITLGAHEGATVTGLPETATNGSEVTFTVTADEGKELVAVKVGGNAIETTEGSYKFTVVGNMTVTVETKEAGAQDAEVLYTLTTSTAGKDNGYATSEDITVDGIVWNVTGNTTMNPWRLGGKNLSGVDRCITGKTAINGKITKLDIEFGAANITVNSVTLKVYSSDPTAEGAEAISSITVNYAANSTVTVMADGDWTNCYYQLVFNVTAGSSNQYVTVSTIKFYGFAATTGGTEVTTPETPEATEAKTNED